MAALIVIVDCGEGNVHSVQKMMSMINFGSRVTSSPADIAAADKIILPGIGHFQTAMDALGKSHLIEPLNEAVTIRKKPILGICLGMQLMAVSSEEGNSTGLGWVEGAVVRFGSQSPPLKVPHMGWNTITLTRPSRLMQYVADGSEFYFAHSYHWKTQNPCDVVCETEYGIRFPSAIEIENIFGVQFHPEKSHDNGLQLLRNFAAL